MKTANLHWQGKENHTCIQYVICIPFFSIANTKTKLDITDISIHLYISKIMLVYLGSVKPQYLTHMFPKMFVWIV